MSVKSNSPIDVLDKNFDSLKRGSPENLEAFLTVVHDEDITEDNTHLYIKFVSIGLSKVPRTQDLCRWLADAVTDYVHPRERIEEAKRKDEAEKVTQYTSELKELAKGRFTKLKTSGEFGEILIYALLERFLQMPQLVAKMDLKTNPELHFNGADGIHLDKDGKSPVLIISESKLKKDLGDGIRECLQSIDTILSKKDDKGKTTLSKEIYVIRNHLNIPTGNFKEAMKKILDPNLKYQNQIELRAAGLVCFDYDRYKNKDQEKLTAEVKATVEEWKKAYLTRLKTHRKKFFKFVFFLIPLPSVEEIRTEFKKALGI